MGVNKRFCSQQRPKSQQLLCTAGGHMLWLCKPQIDAQTLTQLFKTKMLERVRQVAGTHTHTDTSCCLPVDAKRAAASPGATVEQVTGIISHQQKSNLTLANSFILQTLATKTTPPRRHHHHQHLPF